MLREILESVSKKKVLGYTPGGGISIIIDKKGNIVGGTDPWNNPVKKNAWLLGGKGKTALIKDWDKFVKAVFKDDVKGVNEQTHFELNIRRILDVK